jgi:hypothetical protein
MQTREVEMNTLAEVAETMQLAKVMKEPERFLTRQLKLGRIRGRKIGRTWMMTDADVAYAVEQFANPKPRTEPVAPAGAPSVASMRRRRRVA